MSAYLPELAPLPEVDQFSTTALRLKDTLLKRMPPVSDTSLDRYYAPGARAEEAAAQSFAIGQAFETTRQSNRARKNRFRAKERAQNRAIRQSDRQVDRTGRKLVNTTKKREKQYVRNVARNMGLGTDLYR